MMGITLDCSLMTDRRQAHEYLKEKFGFPDHYGKNLDALYDLLSSCGSPREIRIVHASVIEQTLGGYGSALLATIKEAAEDNPRLTLTVEMESGT